MIDSCNIENGYVIERDGSDYLVLRTFGDFGTVASMKDNLAVIKNFRFERCKLVKTAEPGEWGFLPDGLWKYVRFADGQVWFCDATSMYASHKQLVNNRGPNIPAVFAGTIKVRDQHWVISQSGGQSAHLSRGSSDEKYIQRNLNPSMVLDFEMLY